MSRFKSIAKLLLPPVLVPKAWGSPYESANWSPRRGSVPGASPTDSRNELTPGVRTELVRKARYLHKNSGFVRELVANMAIYSTGDGIRVQAQSAKPDWNRAAEAYFALWSARCEVTRRFSFQECQSLVCRGMDIARLWISDCGLRIECNIIGSHECGDIQEKDQSFCAACNPCGRVSAGYTHGQGDWQPTPALFNVSRGKLSSGDQGQIPS